MTVLGTLGVTGISNLNGGVMLPTPGGTANLLNYYEVGTFIASVTGPWSTTGYTMTFQFTMIGISLLAP